MVVDVLLRSLHLLSLLFLRIITMKRALLLILAILPILSLPAFSQGQLKVATVDMQKLWGEYYRTKEAQKEMNVERARIQKENNERLGRIRELETELQDLRKKLEDPTLIDKRKEELFKEFKTKQQEGISLDRERRDYLQRRTAALQEKIGQRMRGIFEEIRKLVEEHAKEESFDYVFDKSGRSATQVPFLLYSKDSVEITGSILTVLNEDAPEVEAAKAPAAAE